MTDGERVKEIRKKNGLTLEKFGERLGVAKTTISRIENGINNLTDQMCKLISREFHVNEEWLKTGIGKMEDSSINDAASSFASDHGLTSMEESLIREYLNLNEHERAVFRRYLKRVIRDITATDSEPTIDEKVEEYREELEVEAASKKSEASPTIKDA